MAKDKDGKLLVTPERAEEMKAQMRKEMNYDKMTPERQADLDKRLDKLMDERVTVTEQAAANTTTTDEEDDEMDSMMEKKGPGEGKKGPTHDDDDEMEL